MFWFSRCISTLIGCINLLIRCIGSLYQFVNRLYLFAMISDTTLWKTHLYQSSSTCITYIHSLQFHPYSYIYNLTTTSTNTCINCYQFVFIWSNFTCIHLLYCIKFTSLSHLYSFTLMFVSTHTILMDTITIGDLGQIFTGDLSHLYSPGACKFLPLVQQSVYSFSYIKELTYWNSQQSSSKIRNKILWSPCHMV